MLKAIKQSRLNATEGKSFLIYLSFTLLNAILPFALIPFLTKYLTPYEYGQVALFQGLFVILTAIIGLGLDGAVAVNYFTLDSKSFKSYVFNAIFIITTFTFLLSLICLFIYLEYENVAGLSPKWIGLSIVISAMQVICNILLSILRSSGKAFFYGSLQFFQLLTNMILSVVLIVTFGMHEEGRIIGIATGVTLTFILSSIFLIPYISNKIDKNHLLGLSKFIIPLLPHLIIGSMYGVLDRFIVNQFLGSHATGQYFVALQLAAPIAMLGDAFNKTYAPWIFKQVQSASAKSALSVSHFMALAFLAISILYTAAVYEFFKYFVDDAYKQSILPALVLIFAAFSTSATYSYVNFIYAFKFNWIMSLFTTISFGLYLILGSLFVPANGLVGMATVAVFVKLVTLLLMMYAAITIIKKQVK